MRREPLGGWVCLLGLVMACGPGIDNQDAPREDVLPPPSAVVVTSIAINDSAPVIQLLVWGTDFIPATAVYVRQVPIPTEFVSDTQLLAQLDPDLVEGHETFPLDLRVAPGNPPFLLGAKSPTYTVTMPGR